MLTLEDLFVLTEVKANGYAIGAAGERASGYWVISAVSPERHKITGEGANRSEAIWSLRDAIFRDDQSIE